ncbi:hypothetical protein BV898_10495 [Hypsibius exemplaris]|uniref:Uncharacterized protein n=1 Tax=Hypsibius exemplaris TaxID=2072580 RepID=A0A1W0WJ64_HYPEX|nr:hypothetical protein BV898_10495 [Hypsibius exemplaris]
MLKSLWIVCSCLALLSLICADHERGQKKSTSVQRVNGRGVSTTTKNYDDDSVESLEESAEESVSAGARMSSPFGQSRVSSNSNFSGSNSTDVAPSDDAESWDFSLSEVELESVANKTAERLFEMLLQNNAFMMGGAKTSGISNYVRRRRRFAA